MSLFKRIKDPSSTPPETPEPEQAPQQQPQPQSNLPRPSQRSGLPSWLPRAVVGIVIVLVVLLLIVFAPRPTSEESASEGDTAAETNGAADEEAGADEADEERGDDEEDIRSRGGGDAADAATETPTPTRTPRPTRDSDAATRTARPTATPPPGASQPQAPTTTPLPGTQPPDQDSTDGSGGPSNGQALLVFQEEFLDNRNLWTTGRFNDMETSTIENGTMRVAWDGEGSSYEVYEGQRFTNFVAEVECAVVQGVGQASCGIIVTANQAEGAYEYEVLNDLYRLGFYSQQGETLRVPLSGDPASSVKTTGINRLRLEHEAPEMRLYLNDQLLDSTSAIALGSSNVGISTNSYAADGAEIIINSFRIWALP